MASGNMDAKKIAESATSTEPCVYVAKTNCFHKGKYYNRGDQIVVPAGEEIGSVAFEKYDKSQKPVRMYDPASDAVNSDSKAKILGSTFLN